MSRQKVTVADRRILQKCREQVGYSIEEVEKEVDIKNLDKMESDKIPATFTFRKLEKLAEMYYVPQWVFLRKELPSQYDFEGHMPCFRKFAKDADASEFFSDPKTKAIMIRVEQFRELVMEIRADMDKPIAPFEPPFEPSSIKVADTDISDLARSVREWLGVDTKSHKFDKWRKILEEKGIFVFMTSKYKGWAKVDPASFRGFAIYKEVLPIIVINDSDSMKAQSFTLFHELGHLLRKEDILESSPIGGSKRAQETWCDNFAGEVLMPEEVFSSSMQKLKITDQTSTDDLASMIDKVAKEFHVSLMACAIRMRQFRKIKQHQCEGIRKYLNEKYEESREKEKPSGKRNIPKERIRQYGSIYSKAIVQAYLDKEIRLHKLCKLLEIRNASDAIKVKDFL